LVAVIDVDSHGRCVHATQVFPCSKRFRVAMSRMQ
jgi:hypothetical protein